MRERRPGYVERQCRDLLLDGRAVLGVAEQGAAEQFPAVGEQGECAAAVGKHP